MFLRELKALNAVILRLSHALAVFNRLFGFDGHVELLPGCDSLDILNVDHQFGAHL
jgi:hypothetical protein